MKCFVLQKHTVSGPFEKEDLRKKIASGEFAKNSQIWWSGQQDWMQAKAWLEHKFDETNIQKLKLDANWFIEREGKTFGPLTRVELVGHLKSSKNLNTLKVWKRGQKARATVYQHNDLTDALGIVQRKSPRAPVVGDIVVSNLEGDQMTAKLCSISEGGLGMTDVPELENGEKVFLEIDSPLLADKIACDGFIRYKTPNGRIGIQFEQLTSESVTNIVDYIKQFARPETKKKAA